MSSSCKPTGSSLKKGRHVFHYDISDVRYVNNEEFYKMKHGM